MSYRESPVLFRCGSDRLLGMLHLPPSGALVGVLIVVGGPQTRVGSHRLFVKMARSLAAIGIPVMRFDHRGIGDSEGEVRRYDAISDDIRAACDAFQSSSGVESIVLWGLCDAASAALLYASTDERVKGLVLLNPWVRTDLTLARTYIRSHYLKRLFSMGLWRKIGRGEFRYRDSLAAFLDTLRRARPGLRTPVRTPSEEFEMSADGERMLDAMYRSLSEFEGKILIILSGRDMTGEEFRLLIGRQSKWRERLTLPSVKRHELAEADHTFSKAEWSDEVAAATTAWIQDNLD